jgi:hypothetical protein
MLFTKTSYLPQDLNFTIYLLNIYASRKEKFNRAVEGKTKNRRMCPNKEKFNRAVEGKTKNRRMCPNKVDIRLFPYFLLQKAMLEMLAT